MDYIERLRNLLEATEFVSPSLIYGVTLEPSAITRFSDARTQGYRLYVRVSHTCKVDPNIFVYQRKPILYGDDSFKDDFSNVASAADLEEYQVDEPADPDRPFFRLCYVDLVFRNPDLLAEAVVGIYTDVRELVLTLDAMNSLSLISELNIGNTTCVSSSSSCSITP